MRTLQHTIEIMFISLFITIHVLYYCKAAGTGNVIVNSYSPDGILPKIWTNTGFSPPGPGKEAVEYLLSRDVKFNLALIGGLPHKGILYVRIHWLLDLISVRKINENGIIQYKFTNLDTVMDLLITNGLRPTFELMGNPGGAFTDINNNGTQLNMWKTLITAVASRYIDRYGLGEVMQWRFETWNEPDLKKYNVLNFTVAGFLNYVKASREGLDDAVCGLNVTLQMGGPAGLFKDRRNHKLCWSFLLHCKQNPCGIHFFSFHKKGNGSAEKVVEESVLMSNKIKRIYGKEAPPPIANTEADILSGWWRNESWRADVRYAAAVCTVLTGILHQLSDKMLILSNDNGFLNYHPQYFTQRTLLTRFQMNNSIDRHSQFFQKPVYSVMGMLAYVGNEKLSFSQPDDDRLKILASYDRSHSPWTASIIVICSTDDMAINATPFNVPLKIYLPNISGTYSTYMLENTKPHPVAVWSEAGSPEFPDQQLRYQMRKSQGPHRTELKNFENRQLLDVTLKVTVPSVTLIHICERGSTSMPGKVTKLRALNVTYNEVLLLWSDEEVISRCILTYEVEFCPGDCVEGNFKRINKYNITFLSFQYTPTYYKDMLQDKMQSESVVGQFRLRAIDYWNSPGLYSDIFSYK